MAGLNINSLLAHIDELRIFLSNHKIDILALNETKLDSTILDNEISLPGFDVIRKDRTINGRNGGGVCLYIRNCLNYIVRDDLQNDKLEFISIEITNPHSKPFIVSTWYRPPKGRWPTTEIFEAFEELITKVDVLNLEFYLIGDINVNLLTEALDYEAKIFINILDIFGLSQLINKPTRITRSTISLIDLCITNSPDKILNSGVLTLGISDHSLVYMSRKIHYSNKNSNRIIEKRSFRHFNSEEFVNNLSQQKWCDIEKLSDPNEMWHEWKRNFMSCFDKHAPIRKKRIGNKRSPWINNELIKKLQERDLLKKKADKTSDDLTWKKYKKVRNSVNNAIKTAKRNYFTINLDNSKGDVRKTWKLINELSSRQYKTTDISELKINGHSISSANAMSEAFNSYFTSIGRDLANEIPKSDTKPEWYMKPNDKVFSFQKIQESEIHKLISGLDSNKATGLDNISCKILKLAANIVVPTLTLIFNQSIEKGIFPDEWKSAKVTPIFNNGSRTDLENYRPISVLPVVAKIFEKAAYNQLYNYFNDNNLLADCQSGFRSLHSTLSAMLEVTNHWSMNVDNGFLNGVLFIDLKKAFDTIDHEIIMRKLSFYGADQTALRWFLSYLSNRVQRCQVNGELSTANSITCGVPPGSIIGPLLFLIYINDLPNCLTEANPRMYTDDTNITVLSDNITDLKQRLNIELVNLNKWLRVNKLSLNITKTEYMIIGSRQRLRATTDNEVIEITIEGKAISRVKEAKSLGVHIDDNLTWKTHIEKISKKISSGIGALKRLRPYISQDTALRIYKSLIAPHFDYCSGVWYGISKTLSDKLQKLQNRAARIITKSSFDTSASLLLNLLDLDNLSTRRKKQLALAMFKSLHGLFPSYLQNLFVPCDPVYNLRNMENKLSLPKPRTNYLKHGFGYCGAALWNSLPPDLRSADSLSTFKRKLSITF